MLNKYRLEHNLTLKEMAKLLDLSISSYYSYEKGRRQMPYKILRNFLLLRNEGKDIELANIIDEFAKDYEH